MMRVLECKGIIDFIQVEITAEYKDVSENYDGETIKFSNGSRSQKHWKNLTCIPGIYQCCDVIVRLIMFMWAFMGSLFSLRKAQNRSHAK